MVSNVLAPCVTRSSATMIIKMQDNHVYVSHKEEFQLPVSSQFWEIRKMQIDFHVFLTHLSLVPHICISKSGQDWFR